MADSKQASDHISRPAKKCEMTKNKSFLSRPDLSSVYRLLTLRQRAISKCVPVLRHVDDLIATVRPNLISIENLILVLTGKCNLHCVYCEYPRRYRGQNEMTPKEWMEIISNAIASGIKYFGIMGGEPLLLHDLSCIVKACLPIRPYLVTNGTLIDLNLAEEISNWFSHVKISLDASNADTYQAVHRNKGFTNVLQAIDLLTQRDVNMSIGYVIFDKNVADIVSAAELAASFGCTIIYSIVGFENNNRTASEDRTLRDNIDKNVLLDMLTRIAHMPHVIFNKKVIEFLLDVRPKRCYASVSSLLIDPLGDVYPCCGPTPPIGNIRNESLKIILSRHRSSLKKYRLMKANGCRRCDAAVDGFQYLRRMFWGI